MGIPLLKCPVCSCLHFPFDQGRSTPGCLATQAPGGIDICVNTWISLPSPSALSLRMSGTPLGSVCFLWDMTAQPWSWTLGPCVEHLSEAKRSPLCSEWGTQPSSTEQAQSESPGPRYDITQPLLSFFLVFLCLFLWHILVVPKNHLSTARTALLQVREMGVEKSVVKQSSWLRY